MPAPTTLTAIYMALSAATGAHMPIGGETNEFISEAYCLARVIYTEARSVRSETLNQMIADVVVNAARADNVTICAEARSPGRYSGYMTDAPNILHPVEYRAWKRAARSAVRKLTVRIGDDMTKGANHFYMPRHVKPRWARAMQETAVASGFRFMKERG